MEFLILVLTWLSLQFAPKAEWPAFQTALSAAPPAAVAETFRDEAYKVEFEIRLGSADQTGCHGSGLCYIRIWFRGSALFVPEPRTGLGTGSFENDHLTILFDLSKMESATRKTFFGSDKFIVDADYPISDEVANALKIKGYTVAKGSYPIKMVSTNIAQVVF